MCVCVCVCFPCYFFFVVFVFVFSGGGGGGGGVDHDTSLSRRAVSSFIPAPISFLLDRVAQTVTCLTTDECPNANPGATSLITARSYTFVE